MAADIRVLVGSGDVGSSWFEKLVNRFAYIAKGLMQRALTCDSGIAQAHESGYGKEGKILETAQVLSREEDMGKSLVEPRLVPWSRDYEGNDK